MRNNKPDYARKTIKAIRPAFRTALVILLNIIFISLYFSTPVIAENDIGAIILKDLKAELSSEDIMLKLILDNQAAGYLKGTPVVEIYKKDQLITNKASGDYILLPNNTNIITIYYSKSFFDEGDYTIRSKVVYDKEESNTLVKKLSITSDGKLSMENAREVITSSSSVPLKDDVLDSNNTFIILILVCMIMLFFFMQHKRSQIQNTDPVDVVHPKTESEKLYGTILKPGAVTSEETPSIPPTGSGETLAEKEAPPTITENIAKEDSKNENMNMQKILGRDVMHAVDEEKERLKEEITDLEKLRQKDILDPDIYEKNRKLIEERLEHLSIDSLLSEDLDKMDLNSGLTEKLKIRKEKIIETIDLIEKLYTWNMIDEEIFIKNKNELKSALDKLKSVDKP